MIDWQPIRRARVPQPFGWLACAAFFAGLFGGLAAYLLGA